MGPETLSAWIQLIHENINLLIINSTLRNYEINIIIILLQPCYFVGKSNIFTFIYFHAPMAWIICINTHTKVVNSYFVHPLSKYGTDEMMILRQRYIFSISLSKSSRSIPISWIGVAIWRAIASLLSENLLYSKRVYVCAW